MSEIAGNKWEADAAKPPLFTVPAIAQILMMGCFASFFVYILVFSVIGIVTPKVENELTSKFKTMNQEAPAAAPAEEK